MCKEKLFAGLLGILFLLLSGCANRQQTADHAEATTDLPAIRQRGELVALTLYSSTSYFNYRGEPMGFQYELCRQFADSLGVTLKVKVANSPEELIRKLQQGEGDLIAYNLNVTNERKDSILFCGEENLSHQVLVQRAERNALKDVTEMPGKTIHVKPGRYQQRLENLNNELGGGILIHPVTEDSISEEDLIEQVALGKIDYTICDNEVAKVNRTYYSNLGYVVLSKVIEKVSGLPYETYMQDSILHPIGCMDMHIGYSSPEKRFPNEVHYYEPSDAEPTESALDGKTMVPKSYGGSDLQVLSGAGGWVASPTELMRFITAIDDQDSKPDILKPSSIALMTEKDENRYPIGWMRTTRGDDWTRTGTLAGSSVMLKRQHNGYTWVFITNTSSWSGSRFPRKIENMIRQALDKVKAWPKRDLFDKDTTLRGDPDYVDSLDNGTALITPKRRGSSPERLSVHRN